VVEYNQKEDQLALELATVDDFKRINLSSIIAMTNSLHFRTLYDVFFEAAQTANESGDVAAERAYRVLAVICSYHFNPNRADAFSTQTIIEDRRALIPSDYIGEQQYVLCQVAENIDHPLLRARIADSCWYTNRKLNKMAEVASRAYLEAVRLFFTGDLLYQYESDFEVPSKVVDLIERSFEIYASVGKRKSIPESDKGLFSKAYNVAKDKANLVAFHRLSTLGRKFEIIEWSDLAKDAESMAIATKDKPYAEAVKKIWFHAANAYSRIGDKDSSRRCKINAVSQTLRMRDAVGSSMAKASWTRDAIGELRSIGGLADRIDELKLELQKYEEDSLSELGEFSIPIDLTDARKATIKGFEGVEVHEMLYRLAFGSRPPEKVALHKSCLEKKNRYFLSSSMGKSYSDHEGKMIAQSPSAGYGEKPSEGWFDHESLVEAGLRYHIETEGFIKPACVTMTQTECIDERHLEPLVYHSAFVPPGHDAIFALGFARMIQGDMVTAVHTLVPQLENSLRYVLTNRGGRNAKLNSDLTQEDQSLSQMYLNRKVELEQAFGMDITYMFHLLFNLKGGPMLRHEMAHGKLTTNDCYSAPCIYACWLMFHITCSPLAKIWKTHIEPAIQEIVH
jgi:hypothetical protein